MRIAIIAAMDEEILHLKKSIDKYEMYEFQGFEYHIGEISNHKIVLVKSGIGKVNAALSTALLLEHFKVTEVINTGSSGAIDLSFSVGDIVIANKCIYHDVDATAFGYAYGQVPNMPKHYTCDQSLVATFTKIMTSFELNYIVGTIATGDSFISDRNIILSLCDKIPNIAAVEMEAAAVMQVCYQYDIPTIVVRSISDIVGKNSNVTFTEYIDLASKNSTNIILHYLENRI
ncbi:MAG: 5'-methylthioadenosine/adenosylhomocysteine nucleosidase [Culicoidibacterales bacterium]